MELDELCQRVVVERAARVEIARAAGYRDEGLRHGPHAEVRGCLVPADDRDREVDALFRDVLERRGREVLERAVEMRREDHDLDSALAILGLEPLEIGKHRVRRRRPMAPEEDDLETILAVVASELPAAEVVELVADLAAKPRLHRVLEAFDEILRRQAEPLLPTEVEPVERIAPAPLDLVMVDGDASDHALEALEASERREHGLVLHSLDR